MILTLSSKQHSIIIWEIKSANSQKLDVGTLENYSGTVAAGKISPLIQKSY